MLTTPDQQPEGSGSLPETPDSSIKGKKVESLQAIVVGKIWDILMGIIESKKEREEKVKRRRSAIEEKEKWLRSIPVIKARFPDKEEEIEQQRQEMQERYDLLSVLNQSPPDGLRYFPGMPELTLSMYIETVYPFSLILQDRDNRGYRTTTDVETYDVYIGQKSVGRFTIRRPGDFRVERNFFMVEPYGEKKGTSVSLGYGGTVLDDIVRQAREWFQIALKVVKKISPL